MESLDDIIIKRRSWAAMLTLLTPDMAPQHAHMLKPAEEQWNAIPLQRQRQIWVTLWELKMRGLKIKDHPYYAIKDCVPMPFNWNALLFFFFVFPYFSKFSFITVSHFQSTAPYTEKE